MGMIMDTLKQDVDRLLSYNTKQQVNILDRYLGLTQYLLTFGIMCYIVGYVFIIDEGYLEYEQSKGVTATHVRGDAVASTLHSTRYFSADEITYPGLENGNVFVATKIFVQKQKRGVCQDFSMPKCMSKEDCSKGVETECTADGYCKEPSWCPVEGSEIDEYKLDTDTMDIWVKSSIQFLQLNKDMIFTNNLASPVTQEEDPKQYNTLSVRQILLRCSPPVRYEEISELGAAIEVQFVWECNAEGKEENCNPTIRARRVDSLFSTGEIGFEFHYPHYTGKDTRDLYTMRGIRFYIRTVGTGRKVSITAIIFKASTGIALLGFAPIIADLLMLKVFKLKKKYHARKYEYSQDFSEYFDQLAAAEAEKGGAEEVEDDGEDDQADEEWRRRMEEEDD